MSTGETTPIGSIHISPKAIATIAWQAALQSYGVVGLAPKNLADNLANRIVKDPLQGVEVSYDGSQITIDLYVIIEYGTRIKSVANSIANTVRYNVEKAIGLPVQAINVHVQGLRVSNPD
ncbi:MAG: Asp23/Gls24 family envelope stress response protein [Anaerolineae bacterium]|nr:MAG: Asp23/Gls24 family envelope stress response protein [Anaerolineae bacterium]